MPRMIPAWLPLNRHSDIRIGMSTEKVSPVWWARYWPRQSAVNPAVQGALDIGDGPLQFEPRQWPVSHRAEVCPQQRRIGGIRRAMVDREVRQVEVQIAHPGVLPVDDDHPSPVVDQVRAPEVVMAGADRRFPRLQGLFEAGESRIQAVDVEGQGRGPAPGGGAGFVGGAGRGKS